MSENQLKPKFYPLKPTDGEGFKKAVAWFGGRELVASLKGMMMYAVYGENMDPRSWMKGNIYPNIEEKVKFQNEDKVEKDIKKQAEKSENEYEKLNSVVNTQVAEEIRNNAKIQSDIVEKVYKDWEKKIFDYWEWKRNHFGFWEKYLEKQDFWQKLKADDKKIDEFWFDYIADSGDGQMGVFNVGCMCYSDLWLKGETVGSGVEFVPPKEKDWGKYELLPRGYFLFVGGDTAYHSANYATLFERFQTPFRWGFTSVRKFLFEKYEPKTKLEEIDSLHNGKVLKVLDEAEKRTIETWDGTICAEINSKLYWDTEPPRPFFGIPANHDYYDSIDGFNKQFRRSPFNDTEENMIYEGSKGRAFLQLPSFSREQEASYIAIRLPFDWWMFGIDSENEKLDFRQEIFFKQIMEKYPSKLILATPEPTTVFGKQCTAEEKTATYLKSITELLGLEQPFLTDGKFKRSSEIKYPISTSEEYCRLDLSGDVHHYARYWGENTREFDDEKFASTNYASLVSGGGGAFFDSTSTLIGQTFGADGKPLTDKDGKKVRGDIPPQKLYPSERESISRTADKLFDLWNIKKGGYVQYGGAFSAVIIFFFLTQFSNVSNLFEGLQNRVADNGFDGVIPKNGEGWLLIFARIILLAVIACVGLCAYRVNRLIKDLKEKSFEDKIKQETDGRILQLIRTSAPLWVGVILYVSFVLLMFGGKFFISNNSQQTGFQDYSIEGFTNSLFVAFHIIIAALLIWLSFDYANWLVVRFKLTRKFTEKTFAQKCEDSNEKTDSFWLQLLGKFTREFSYKYFPAIVLVIFAAIVLIIGLGIFGRAQFVMIFADLILTLVIIGGFFIFAYLLAYSVGAAYQNQKGKRRFLLLGIWHAVLQIVVPFVLFYFANWIVVLLIFVLVIIINGFSKAAYRVNKFFPNAQEVAWQKRLQKWVNYRLGASLMKRKDSKRLLTGVWILYGLVVLVTPFAVAPFTESLNQTVCERSKAISFWIGKPTANENIAAKCEDFEAFSNTSKSESLAYWIYISLSLIIVGFIGYRMSRVWFSWYLAVSVLFDGHNNEAGGMARIEDFKHILRIKVEREKLTVYVIGLDDVRPDLDENLKLKLVDRFELKCQPID